MLTQEGQLVQTWAPHVGVTDTLDTNTTRTLVAGACYTIVATQDFWWIWGTTATAGNAASGYWPANIPLFLNVQGSTVLAHIKNATAGYITFYRNA